MDCFRVSMLIKHQLGYTLITVNMEHSQHQVLSNINNLGAVCIENGDLPQAMHFLRLAVQHVKTEVTSYPRKQASPSDAGTGEQSRNSLSTSAKQCLSSQHAADNYFDNEDNVTDTHQQFGGAYNRFVYSRGMRMLTAPGDCFSHDLVQDGTIRSAIVVYNLALVFHLKGFNKNEALHLQKAKHLYEHSYQLLVDTIRPFGGGPTGNASVDLLVLALMNNLAEISLEMSGYYDDTRAMFEHLLEFAVSTRSREYGEEEVSAFMEQESSYFLLNASILGLAPAAAAAAA
jgi:hypothetical protein